MELTSSGVPSSTLTLAHLFLTLWSHSFRTSFLTATRHLRTHRPAHKSISHSDCTMNGNSPLLIQHFRTRHVRVPHISLVSPKVKARILQTLRYMEITPFTIRQSRGSTAATYPRWKSSRHLWILLTPWDYREDSKSQFNLIHPLLFMSNYDQCLWTRTVADIVVRCYHGTWTWTSLLSHNLWTLGSVA